MTGPVTVARLAKAKSLPEADLHRFGLRDTPRGVRFRYVGADLTPGRARDRTAMRGVDGSSWADDGDEPIVAYWLPESAEFVADLGYQLVVEGESDCWTAWHYGRPAVGIPGSDQVGTLERAHVGAAREVFVQVEAASERTFPAGVDAYVGAVTDRLRQVGFLGPVYRLTYPDGVGDLSELHANQGDADDLRQRLDAALAKARG